MRGGSLLECSSCSPHLGSPNGVTWRFLPQRFADEFHRVALDADFRIFFDSATAAVRALTCLETRVCSRG